MKDCLGNFYCCPPGEWPDCERHYQDICLIKANNELKRKTIKWDFKAVNTLVKQPLKDNDGLLFHDCCVCGFQRSCYKASNGLWVCITCAGGGREMC